LKTFNLIMTIILTIIFIWQFITFAIASFNGDLEGMVSSGIAAIILLILSAESRADSEDCCR
jgi:hypothetical protein